MKRFLLYVCLLALAVGTVAATATAQEDEPDTQDTESEVITTRDSMPDASQFELVAMIGGFRNPLYVTHAGDGSGRLFVVEQTGNIWIIDAEGRLLNTPFIDLSGIVSQDVLARYSERGLLGLAFHPDYAENGQFYVNYTDQEGMTHVVNYSVSADDPNLADPASARELLTINQPYANHNGGHMSFGPDGYLYISVGDGGSRDDPLDAGQNPSTLLGTILRIDVDDFDIQQPYGIPEGNPFNRDLRFAPEVWAYGLRNVWRFSFDRATGDMYLADVGQNEWEEVNFQPADSEGGENYGWVAYEATHRYRGEEPQGEVVMPVAEYDHSLGCSITGGYVYRGEAVPELQGAYLYSDYCSGRIWAAYRDESGAWQSGQVMGTGFSVSSFGEDEAGELYLVNYTQGNIWKFVPVE